ncbi:glycosyltransferase family 2 protein [Flavobacteriaceae bacterium]|jgi:GT2 family glycosyltransferase|nr:glycosyltransferase family 2 protein [Flavobacteriaceae bacterium]
MQLSIIILNYNVKYFLEICLKSVIKATLHVDAEIIVIDNDSNDGSVTTLEKKFPEVIFITNTTNLGFSKGNNQGVKIAKGDYVCILNPDTVVAEDTFLKLLKFVKTKPNCGVVGCKLVDGTGRFLPESKRNVPIIKTAIKKLYGNDNTYYANHVELDAIGKVDILVGAFMFIKKTVYDQVGGFDEDYFMYGEDIDLSYKLLKADFQNYYFGETTCIHYKGESTVRNKSYYKRFFGAMRIFYNKHFKTNFVIDAVIMIGIHMSYLVSKQSEVYKIEPVSYFYISDVENLNLKTHFKEKIFVQNHIQNIKDGAEVIFNGSFFSYKKIIESMENLSLNKSLTFKILPESTNFLIGSNSVRDAGNVIQLKDN